MGDRQSPLKSINNPHSRVIFQPVCNTHGGILGRFRTYIGARFSMVLTLILFVFALTPSVTYAADPTATATPSASDSSSATATPTAEPSASLSATESVTATPTETSTPSATPSPSDSASASATASASPTPSSSPTTETKTGARMFALAAVAAATGVDLVTSVTAPTSGIAGDTFEATITITNNGADDATNAATNISFTAGTTNLAGTWVSSTGGASGTWDSVKASANGSSPMNVTGTIASIPAGGSVTLKVTGKYPTSGTTEAITATATPGDGVADTNSADNTVTKNVTLTSKTQVTVTTRQDSANVASGSKRTVWFTYTNDGPSDLIGVRPTGSYDYNTGNLVNRSVTIVLNCDTGTTITCPVWYNNTTSTRTLWSNQTLFNNATIDIPAGKTLVIKAEITDTFSPCDPDGTTPGTVYTRLDAASGTTMVNSAGQSVTSIESTKQAGTLTGEICNMVNMDVRKSQDKTSVGSGETRTYTLTYANTSATNNLVGGTISDTYTAGTGTQTYSYKITCAPTSTATCPSWANGTVQTKTVSGSQSLFGTQTVDIPAQKQLVLNVEMVQTLTTCQPSTGFAVGNTTLLGSPLGTVYINTRNAETRQIGTGNLAGTITTTDASVTSSLTDASGATVSQAKTAGNLNVTVASGCNTATNVPVETTVDTAGFKASAGTQVTCVATGGAVCPDASAMTWDVTTGKIKATIPSIPAGGKVVLSLAGTTGLKPAATTYVATSKISSVGDINQTNNISTLNFNYTNSQTTLTIHQNVAGFPSSGATEDLKFIGTATCEGIDQPIVLDMVIPAGSNTATLTASDQVWLKSSCNITVTRPAAPRGYRWINTSPVPVNNAAYTWDAAQPATATAAEDWTEGPLDYTFNWQLELDPAQTEAPQLPLTGGVGTYLYTIAGTSILLVSLLAALIHRRRRN